MSHITRQRDIKKATYRMITQTPAHIVYGFWINGAKIGELTIGQEEHIAFSQMMRRAGFSYVIPKEGEEA